MTTFIIAEAGVNHNGNLDIAHQLIDVAADAGANAVKFQTFRAEALVSRNCSKAEYQTHTTEKKENQLEMLRKLELSEQDHERLINHAHLREIKFLSSPFDVFSLEMLTNRFSLETIKIPSGEITNAPFLLAIARSAKKVIMSTGMSTLSEVEDALGVLSFGFTTPQGTKNMPNPDDFKTAFDSKAGQKSLLERVALLHCTTEYPAPYNEINLKAMETLGNAFGLPIGLSDHTQGIHISVAAVACGAQIIEKHFTLDRTLPGPDHKASLEPDELHQLVKQIRDVEQSLGDGIKKPSASELKNRVVARKSLVATAMIRVGEVFTKENLTCKRPGNGISPFQYWQILGQVSTRDYAPDETIDG